MGETHEDRHDGGDFGLPPAPPRRNNDAAHNNGHAAADAPDAMRDARSSPALLSDRPSTSASVSSSVSEHVEDLAVRVAVRARPLVAKERVERARECLSYPRANAVLLGESRAFRFDDAFGPGANVRSVGSDIQRGEVLLHAGDRVGPHELGIAALAGVSEARTRRAPLVAVLSTGDELADPFAETESSRSAGPSGNASASLDVTAGSIFDANRHMLLACAREVGARVMDLGIARDDPDALADAIARAVDAGADVVVASGGVSEGDKDHLKETLLGSFGRVAGEVHFGRVMMKPGKPLNMLRTSIRNASSQLVYTSRNPTSAPPNIHICEPHMPGHHFNNATSHLSCVHQGRTGYR